MAPTTFLFWNLNGKPLGDAVARAAAEHRATLVILAEATGLDFAGSGYREVFQACPLLRVFALPGARVEALRSGLRWTTLAFAPEDGGDLFNVAAAHLPSKLQREALDQTEVCRRFAADIADAEELMLHQRTVVVGDLNADPFEPGILGAVGLHGLMTRSLARRRPRLIDGATYPAFYNPMWSLFGDGSPGPPGSYHYEKAGHFRQSWHLFDQVLLRPALLDRFRHDSLRILDRIGGESLLDEHGIPDPRRFSDHLPLVFAIEANEVES